MRSRVTWWAASAGAVALAASVSVGDCLICPEDLDGSGDMAIGDVLLLLSDWGEAGSPADFDGSGTVDITDLLHLLSQWGPCVFDYGPPRDHAEAWQISLEQLGPTGPLLAPDAAYDRIVRDLNVIRFFYPALGGQTHTKAWNPNELIVKVLDALPHDEYESLKTCYDVIDEEFLFNSGGGAWYVLTFSGWCNVEAMAPVFAAAPEVEFAEPNGIVGGENFWTPVDLGGDVWEWTIDDGFLDCFDGCDCHRMYIIRTDGPGNVTLISYQEFGQPWCVF
ncbi:MAG: hypothetical protein ACYTGG_05565 [Planctomycetota bacterium]|jgi:hypothetical protein